MLTTINEEGSLVSRPLAVQEVKDDGDMSKVTHSRMNVGESGTVEL